MLFPCLVLGMCLVAVSLPVLIAGLVLGDRCKRVFDVRHPLLFWMGRDRISLDVGRALRMVGALLLVSGALVLYQGYTAPAPH